MSQILPVVTAIMIGAGSAHATLFSFRSDDHNLPGDFTFAGTGDQVLASASNPGLELLIDDNNGSQPAIVVDVTLEAAFQIAHIMSVPMGGGLSTHVYSLNGSFNFNDAAGSTLLTATISDGAFTAIGTGDTWFSAAAMFGADGSGGADVTYQWFGDSLPDYGLTTGFTSSGQDDASFSLSFLGTRGSTGAALDSQTLLPTDEWDSEGSFSGTANNFVPAPASMLIASLGIMVMPRRRRA